jgi:prepilin-type N-terminal cleavage/methylation domain-containing protein
MMMTTYRYPRLQSPGGFTLIELMIVVAILGVLVSVATVSYNHFVIKAKAVEGELVVYEVDRLESAYYVANQAFTDSFTNLGFPMAGTLKYYTPEVRMGSATDKMTYQVRAVPITTSGTDAWLLTSYRDGSVQVDRIPAKDLDAYATARYLGNATPIISIQPVTNSQAGGISGNAGGGASNIEPEWSGGGSSKGCQECGRTVKNQDN